MPQDQGAANEPGTGLRNPYFCQFLIDKNEILQSKLDVHFEFVS